MRQFWLPDDQVFIIAEIANAHEGSPKKLAKLVEKAVAAKPDAIKFQLFKSNELLVSNHPDFELYKKLEIPDPEWVKIFRLLKRKKIKAFADVFSVERAKFASRLGANTFKVHSSDVNNAELLEYLASTSRPILLSCSGCTINEIDNALRTIRKASDPQVVLMYGFQGFPTDISQINLRRIASLRKRYGLPVGYMDHIDGSSELAVYLPLAALGFGANIIEKHITLNRALKGEDYQSSLNPDEFATMVGLLRNAYKSLGIDSFEIKGDELTYRKNMKKRLVAARNLAAGHKIAKSDIALKRIHVRVPEISEEQVLGRKTKVAIEREMPLQDRNIDTKKVKVAACIACRVESTRLFAKPLQRVDDRTILDYIIAQLRQCKLVDEIVIAISENQGNEIFVEFARKNDLKFVRGDDEDVLKRIITAAEHVNANVVLRVTSEDPLKYWQAIDSAITQHLATSADFTFTQNLPEGAGFEIINLDALKTSHRRGKRRNRSELVTSYIDEHKEQFKIAPFTVDPVLRRPEIRLTVDYPEDLILIRTIVSRLPESRLPDLPAIIELLDKNPELIEINRKFVDHPNRIWL